MSTIIAGIRIWAVTVFLNAVFWGIGATWAQGIAGLLLAVIFLFCGYLITGPLLLLIVPIITLSRKLPYSVSGKMTWVGFWFILLIIGFFNVLVWMLDGRFFNYDLVLYNLVGVAVAALVIALWIHRRLFSKMEEQAKEKHV